MTSKEALKVLRQYNSVGLCGDKTLFEPIEKDLEDYEELLKIMGTPIEKIMKKLKALEILKKHLKEDGYYGLIILDKRDLSDEEIILLNEVLVND